MNELLNSPSIKEHIANYLYVVSIYFVTVGVLYLWGYWSPFGIDILEYLSLSDILKSTAYPIATTFMLTTIGATIGGGLFNEKHLPPGGSDNTIVKRLLRQFAPFIAGTYVLGTTSLLIFGPVEKWLVLPVLFALPISIFVIRTDFIRDLIPQENLRSIIIYLLAVLPGLGYGTGTLNANKIQTSKVYTYVISDLPGYPASGEASTQPRLIGNAGEHIFFFDPVKTAVIVDTLENEKSLVLKRYQASVNSSQTTRINTSLKLTPTNTPASAH